MAKTSLMLLGALIVVASAPAQEIRQLRMEFRAASGIRDPAASELRVWARRVAGQGRDLSLAGTALELPEGSWELEAASGDWITPRPVEIRIRREEKAADVPLRLVPSCKLVGRGPAGEWQRVPEEEAEILSLDYGSIFRGKRSAGGEIRIPAGSFVVSRMKGRHRVAVSAPLTCAPGKSLPLPFPQTPADGEVTVYLQMELLPPAHSEPAAAFLQTDKQVVSPTAAARAEASQIAIFYGLSAIREVKAQVAHPALLTYVDEISGPGGTVVSETLQLVARKRYELDIDYRPARAHQRAELVMAYCGFAPGSYDCREFGRKPLAEGKNFYSFDGLDRGQYRLSAEIDDFVLDGLGRGMSEQAAKLIEYDERPVAPDSYSISESHIFGNILSAGTAVPGRVVLQAIVRESWPALEFPTDEDLLFHIYYFGAEETVYTMPRDEKNKRSKGEIPRAIPIDYQLAVCVETGFCRHLNLNSRIRGEGRMDLEIAPQAAAQLTIVDQETNEPVAAGILLEAEPLALIFEDGSERWVEPAGAERQLFRTDEKGRVQIPLPGEGPVAVAVKAEGYESTREEIAGEVGKFLRRTIRLKRKASLNSGHRLVFTDGRPVEKAFLLPIEANGNRRFDCYRATSQKGFVRFPEACRISAMSILVLHPQAAITFLDAGAFTDEGETVVAAAPFPALRLKLTREGEPVPGTAIEVQYRGFTVGIDDLLAERLAGHQLFHQTNQLGEMILQGVDPADAPSLKIGGRLFPVTAATRTLEIALD